LKSNGLYHDLCSQVLSLDRRIRFAGILDREGKLLVCKFRENLLTPLVKSSTLDHGKPKQVPTFIESFVAKKKLELVLGKLNYEFNYFERVGVGIFRLVGKQDMYLCVSMESTAVYPNILSKIKNYIAKI